MIKEKRATGDIASTSEVAKELAAMSKADLVRLEQMARLRAAGFAWLDWEDLLHEAISRILAGTRKWPKSLPFPVFMFGTIRSVANELWRSRTARHESTMSELSMHHEDSYDIFADTVDEAPDPEREVIARRLLKKIDAIFKDDPSALAVLRGMANGLTPDEIKHDANMSSRLYASTQKRIRRAMAAAVREGVL